MVVVATGLQFELLNAPPADGLADVEVTLRIDGHHVQERELTGHVPGPAKTGQDFAGRVIEDPHQLVAAIGVVHELLRPIRPAIDVPRVSCRPESIGARNNWNDAMQVTEFVEHLISVVAPIARVDEPLPAHDHAVRMPAVAGEELARVAAHTAPVTQVLS